MARVYLSVGSNIEPERNIPAALELLGRQVEVQGISTFYRTAAIGSPGSPDFYNGVVRIETRTEPQALKFDVLRRIESDLGRVRQSDPNAPRTIDLDILLCEEVRIQEPGLEIPDPLLTSRAFLALPLLELEPEAVLPDGRRLADIASGMDAARMEPLAEFTRKLRQEILHEP